MDAEIFFYDGMDVTRITNNYYKDYDPQISGSNLVWIVDDGHDSEIYVYYGSEIVQLTDNEYDDLDPRISGSNVVWQGWDGQDYEIFMVTIPEPSTLVLLSMGALGLLGYAHRKRRRR